MSNTRDFEQKLLDAIYVLKDKLPSIIGNEEWRIIYSVLSSYESSIDDQQRKRNVATIWEKIRNNDKAHLLVVNTIAVHNHLSLRLKEHSEEYNFLVGGKPEYSKLLSAVLRHIYATPSEATPSEEVENERSVYRDKNGNFKSIKLSNFKLSLRELVKWIAQGYLATLPSEPITMGLECFLLALDVAGEFTIDVSIQDAAVLWGLTQAEKTKGTSKVSLDEIFSWTIKACEDKKISLPSKNQVMSSLQKLERIKAVEKSSHLDLVVWCVKETIRW